jgi:transposase
MKYQRDYKRDDFLHRRRIVIKKYIQDRIFKWKENFRKDEYQNNKESINEKQRKYRKNNLERIRKRDREYRRKYREKNRERIRKYQKEWFLKNRDRIREMKKEYYQKKKLM